MLGTMMIDIDKIKGRNFTKIPSSLAQIIGL